MNISQFLATNKEVVWNLNGVCTNINNRAAITFKISFKDLFVFMLKHELSLNVSISSGVISKFSCYSRIGKCD